MEKLLSADGYKGTAAAHSPQSGLINGQVHMAILTSLINVLNATFYSV